jgi:hypothetical protein
MLAGQRATPTPVPMGITTAKPVLQFEKTRFAIGERVFFWVGVELEGGDQKPIPASLMDSMRVILTRPDHTQRIDRITWPIDGMGTNLPGDGGWRGGHGLRDETPQLGVWIAVVEFAGRRTAPVSFTIENVQILKDIDARFIFTEPLVLNAADAAATLTLRNNSSEVLRFVELGQNNSSVSINLEKTGEPRWGSSFFVPPGVLVTSSGKAIVPMSVTVFTWKDLQSFPIATVPPGGVFQRRLPMRASLEGSGMLAIPPGDFNVRFSTKIDLLVGEADGNWKDFAAVHLAVSSTTTGTWR